MGKKTRKQASDEELLWEADTAMTQSGSPAFELSETVLVGENDYGYQFAVGRHGDSWVGFAVGTTEAGRMLFLFPEISSGVVMGIGSRDEAIRMVGAIAEDPEHGYGGIDRWFVNESLRGTPDEYRCADCGEVGCNGEECHYCDFDYGE